MIVLCIIVVLFLLIALAAYYSTPEKKGQFGESRIYDDLAQIDGNHAIITNCYLPKHNGGTTEIDLILIHESGVYVIESKNYSGWIFGSEDQQYWTQSFRGSHGSSQKFRFYNPLQQNKNHIHCLKSILRDRSIPYYSYIVFGNNCELKDIHLTSDFHHIVYSRFLLKEISLHAQSIGRCLTDEQIRDIYNQLLPFTHVTSEQKDQHIASVQKKQLPVVQPDGTWRCPLCGGTLVQRAAKRSSYAESIFWGCSNYPRCHFIYQPHR